MGWYSAAGTQKEGREGSREKGLIHVLPECSSSVRMIPGYDVRAPQIEKCVDRGEAVGWIFLINPSSISDCKSCEAVLGEISRVLAISARVKTWCRRKRARSVSMRRILDRPFRRTAE